VLGVVGVDMVMNVEGCLIAKLFSGSHILKLGRSNFILSCYSVGKSAT